MVDSLAVRGPQAQRRWRATRWWEWGRRYLPLEISGLITALLAGLLASRLNSHPAAAAVAASFGETVGYYAAAAWAEARRQRGLLAATREVRGAGSGAVAARTLRGLLIEFGPADLLDTLLVRPFLMYAGQVLTGDVTSGLVVGKLAADVVFYALVIPCYEFRKHVLHDTGGPTTTASTAHEHPHEVDGPTPYLRMDLDRVAARYQEFVAAMPDVRIHYAMKCNPDPEVLRLLHDLGCGFEVASYRELEDLMAVGVDASQVLFSNPVKLPRDVARAAAAGLWRFSCDSSAELEKIARAAPGAAVYLRLAVPPAASDVPSEGKFGVGPGDVERLAWQAGRQHGLRVHGLTFHVGSQMTDLTAWERAIATCGELLRSMAADGVVLEMLDIGGGFPARYDEDVPDLSQIGSAIARACARHLPYPVALAAEPGRALVAEAGTMVASVVGIAERAGRRWVHLDVGAFNGMMEALETANRLRFPVRDSRGSAEQISCHLTGPSCDSQDTILFDVFLSADLAVGDTVHIDSAGAYTTSYASTFNGFDIPPVRAVRTGTAGDSPARRALSLTGGRGDQRVIDTPTRVTDSSARHPSRAARPAPGPRHRASAGSQPTGCAPSSR